MTRRSTQSLLPKEAPRKMFTRPATSARPQFVVSKDGLFRQRDGKLTANLQSAEVYNGLVGKALNIAGDIFEIVPVYSRVFLVDAPLPENPQASPEVVVAPQVSPTSPEERVTISGITVPAGERVDF